MRFLLNNLPLKLLSVVLAGITVFAVHLTGRNFYPLTIEARVEMQGLSEDLLVLNRDQVPNRVQLSVQVPYARIDSVRARDFTAIVDLSGFSSPGRYQVPVELPGLGSDVVVAGRLEPVTVELDTKESKVVEVRAEEVGNLPGGLVKGRSNLDPQLVRVTGPTSLMDRISHVQVEVRLGTINSSTERSLPVRLALTDPAEVVHPSELTARVEPAEVSYQINVRNQENLLVFRVQPNLQGEPPAGYALRSNVSISPSRVFVPEDLLQGRDVQRLETDPIDLSRITESTTRSVQIRYPFQTAGEVPSTAEVSIEIVKSRQSYRQVSVSPELIGRRTENFSYRHEPEQLEISVPEELDLDRNELRAVVDVADVGQGEHRLEATPFYQGEDRDWNVTPAQVTVTVTQEEQNESS